MFAYQKINDFPSVVEITFDKELVAYVGFDVSVGFSSTLVTAFDERGLVEGFDLGDNALTLNLATAKFWRIQEKNPGYVSPERREKRAKFEADQDIIVSRGGVRKPYFEREEQ